MASEVEETLKRLVTHKGVIGTIVVNADGIPIKSTLDNHTTTQVSGTWAGWPGERTYVFFSSYSTFISVLWPYDPACRPG